MTKPAPYDYYYSNEADQYTFYRLPKALFTNPRYKGLSGNAKILYGLMLDRMGLSLKNHWVDDNDRVFIYFTLEDVQEYINCQRDTGMKLLAELDTVKGIGLIERIRQGLGKPTIIYVKKFFDTPNLQRSEKSTSGLHDSPTSGGRDVRPTEVEELDCNKTENNKTEMNKTYPIQSYPEAYEEPEDKTRMGWDMDRMDDSCLYRELIKRNIEYSILIRRNEPERVDEILELIVDTVCSQRSTITIASDDYPKEVVKSRFLKLDSSHIEYVFSCIDSNNTKVRNVRKYLLAALYNAPTTMDTYYRAEVNHTLNGR